MTIEQIKKLIVDVPDFPKPGIVFKDITPVFENHAVFKAMIRMMAENIPSQANKIVAVESRGFLFGAALCQYLDTGLILVRKPGKLPRKTIKHSYDLEYGSDTLEMHHDALGKGDNVVIVDDVLATGGTAQAVEKLCATHGAKILGHSFLIELSFLNGRNRLSAPVKSLLHY